MNFFIRAMVTEMSVSFTKSSFPTFFGPLSRSETLWPNTSDFGKVFRSITHEVVNVLLSVTTLELLKGQISKVVSIYRK